MPWPWPVMMRQNTCRKNLAMLCSVSVGMKLPSRLIGITYEVNVEDALLRFQLDLLPFLGEIGGEPVHGLLWNTALKVLLN